MKKFALLAAVTLAAFVAMIPLAYAAGREENAASSIQQRSDYIGALVRNLQGERLGTVRDIVTDSEGNVSFAIVSHGGLLGIRAKETAIPFEALTYKADVREFAIDLSKDKLDFSPRYARDLDLNNHESAETFYRFFGIAPPWGEPKDEHMMNHEEPMQHEKMMDEPMKEEPMGLEEMEKNYQGN